jgi:hypothetical protein
MSQSAGSATRGFRPARCEPYSERGSQHLTRNDWITFERTGDRWKLGRGVRVKRP